MSSPGLNDAKMAKMIGRLYNEVDELHERAKHEDISDLQKKVNELEVQYHTLLDRKIFEIDFDHPYRRIENFPFSCN